MGERGGHKGREIWVGKSFSFSKGILGLQRLYYAFYLVM